MQIVVNIIFLSTFYVAFSVGLALIFGVMRTINYAYGEMFMLGAYTLLGVVAISKGLLPSSAVLILGLILAACMIGGLGALVQRTLVDPLIDKPFSVFMATLGLSYVLQVIMVQSVGSVGRYVPPLFPGIIRIGGAIVPIQRVVVVAVTFAMITGLWYFLMQTKTGRAVRAVSQNKTGAVLQGIDVKRIALVTTVLGGILAAASGVMMGSVTSINPFMGGDAIWRAFIIIIVGGIGSISGAIAAAFVFGALDTLLTTFGYGQFGPMMDALIMLLILAFKPSGVLGARE